MNECELPEDLLREMDEIERLADARIAQIPSPKMLGGFVRFCRELLGWKKETLSSMANVSLSTVERIERGEPVSDRSLDQVAIGLGYKAGDFTEPRVPLTNDQFRQMLAHTVEVVRGKTRVRVRPLRTQPQVAILARTQMHIIDGERLGDDYRDDISGLIEWLELVNFILATEGDDRVIRTSKVEPAKRRELYVDVLNAVRLIERRSASVALAGTYAANTDDPHMPMVEVALVSFFPKASDPSAVKRKTLLAPAKIDVQAAWRRFCAQDPFLT